MATTYEKSKITKEFDIDKALNTSGFLNFLEKFPDGDIFDPNTELEESERRFKLFEQQRQVVRSLKELFKKDIKRDIGINLEDADLDDLGVFVENESIDNPEHIAQILSDIEEHNQLLGDISERERKLAKLGGKERLDEIYDDLKIVKDSKWTTSPLKRLKRLGFLTTEQKQARQKVKSQYKIGLDEIEGKMAGIDSVREAELMFYFKQKDIYEDLSITDTIIRKARDRAQEKLKGLASGTTNLRELEKTKEYLGKLQKGGVGDYLEGLSIDFNGRTDLNENDFEDILNDTIEMQVVEDLKGAIDGFSIGSNPLTALERALDLYFKKRDIGSKAGKEAREYIFDTIKDIIDDAATSISKKILLRRIIYKYS